MKIHTFINTATSAQCAAVAHLVGCSTVEFLENTTLTAKREFLKQYFFENAEFQAVVAAMGTDVYDAHSTSIPDILAYEVLKAAADGWVSVR